MNESSNEGEYLENVEPGKNQPRYLTMTIKKAVKPIELEIEHDSVPTEEHQR